MPFELYFYDDIEGGVSEEFIRQIKRLEDYPNTDAQWAGSFFCSIQNGEMLTKFVYNDREE